MCQNMGVGGYSMCVVLREGLRPRGVESGDAFRFYGSKEDS